MWTRLPSPLAASAIRPASRRLRSAPRPHIRSASDSGVSGPCSAELKNAAGPDSHSPSPAPGACRADGWPHQPLQNVEHGRNEAISQHETQRTREVVYTREQSDDQVIGLGHNGRQFGHRITTRGCSRRSDRPLPQGAGDLRARRTQRAKNPGSKNQGLRSLRAPKPDVVVPARRLVDVWIRGTQILRSVAPGPATEHF